MKVLISSYSFNASNGEISILDYSNIKLDQLLLVTNVSKNRIVYNFANPNLGAFVSNNTIYLSADTSSMDDTDSLQIFIEDYFTPTSEATLTAVNLEIQKSNTLLNVLTSQQTTINLDISAVNVNTDSVEGLIFNTNTKLDVLTGVNYATKTDQDTTNTLLNVLTGVNYATSGNQNTSNTLLNALTSVNYATNSNQNIANTLLNVLTGIDYARSSGQNITNNRLDALTGIDYATRDRQNRTNTLLEELTAKQTTVNLDVSAINLNTDQLESQFDRSNTLLNRISGEIFNVEELITTNNILASDIRSNSYNLPNLAMLNPIYNELDSVENNVRDLRNSFFNGIGGYSIGGYFTSYNQLLSSINISLANNMSTGAQDDSNIKKLTSSTFTNIFVAPSASKLFNIFGITTSSVGQYLQVYDTSGTEPAGTPAAVFFLQPNSNFNFEFVKGIPLTNKKAILVNSLTPNTYNPGNSDLFFTVIFN